jgi:hypothetical protein
MFEMNPYALDLSALPEGAKRDRQSRLDRAIRFLEGITLPLGFMTGNRRPMGEVPLPNLDHQPHGYDRDTINNMIAFDPYADPLTIARERAAAEQADN